MADKYEKDLAQKSSLTTSDFIRVVGSDNVSYKQPINSVGDITKTRVFLASSGNITDSNIDNYTDSGIYQGYFPLTSIGSGGWGTLTVSHANNAVIEQTIVTRSYIAQRHCESGTWSAWVKFPTRAEIDSLNSKTALTITVDSSIINNPSTVTAFRVGNVVAITLWGTTFSSGGNKTNVIRGVPKPIVNTTATFGLGGTNAYITQGNMFIYSSDSYVNLGIRTDYAGGGVFGTLTYLAQ